MVTLARDNTNESIQVLKPSSSTTVSVSATTAASSAVSSQIVRMICTVDCFIKLNAAATTSDMFFPADSVEFIEVGIGETINAITSGATGTLYITEMV